MWRLRLLLLLRRSERAERTWLFKVVPWADDLPAADVARCVRAQARAHVLNDLILSILERPALPRAGLFRAVGKAELEALIELRRCGLTPLSRATTTGVWRAFEEQR